MKFDYAQKDEFDRFYTNPELAQKLVDGLDLSIYNKIIEPSAGTGSFVKAINNRGYNCFAHDLDPETKWIIGDWLETKYTRDKILVVGNPPFGKNGSLALKFINHSAEFAQDIAFILPNSFRKASMISKLDKSIVIKSITECPENSFLFNDQPYNVPCSFFVFEVLKFGTRQEETKLDCDLFSFTKRKNADFSIRRVGVNAGKIGFLDVSEQSNYFIKSNIEIADLIGIFERCDFKTIASNVSGPPSLSKQELIREVIRCLG